MITARAKDSLVRATRKALKSGLGVTEADWTFEVLDDEARPQGRQAVILTVSSYLFRLMTVVYFNEDQPTWRQFTRHQPEPGPLDLQRLHDLVGEFGNVACGALNRDLGIAFPHIGMSTPNVVDSRCIAWLPTLGTGLVKHFRITLADGLALHATLALCDYDDFDFDLPAETESPEAEAETGELELF